MTVFRSTLDTAGDQFAANRTAVLAALRAG